MAKAEQKDLPGVTGHRPKTYREMAVPFDDVDAANEAIQAFVRDVSDARRRHRIRELLVVIQVPVAVVDDDPDGMPGERDATTMMQLGSEAQALSLAAWAHGAMTEKHRELAARAMETGIRQQRGAKR